MMFARSLRLFLVSWFLCAWGCTGYRDLPGTVDARSYYYRDDNGLSVSTTGVAVEQPVSGHLTVQAQALVDHIRLEKSGHSHVDDSGQATGHQHDDVDAVSSASVSTTRGLLERETRYEGTLGVTHYGSTKRGPLFVQGAGRVSMEPDYRSFAGRTRAGLELLSSGTTLTAVAGYGHDVSDPKAAPPGEERAWPATSDRLNFGITLSQVVSPRLVASVGSVLSHQYGTLESPYRRARVSTSLFPERLPEARTRTTSFAALSLYLGANMGLHTRAGVYADDWGVLGLAPEAAWSLELGARGLLALRYRYYRQSAARFYDIGYEGLAGYRTGDARLGRIREHETAAEVSFVARGERNARGSVSFVLGYAFLTLTHLDLERNTRAHVMSGGLSGAY